MAGTEAMSPFGMVRSRDYYGGHNATLPLRAMAASLLNALYSKVCLQQNRSKSYACNMP
jgi:hypothetical protein